MSVRIIADSACDLLPEQAKSLNIELVPLKTRFGEKEYLDGITMNHEEFFKKLTGTDMFPTTSQITPYECEEVYERIKEAGDTAVFITISSKLSGCYQSACLATQEYEDMVHVVDSENACVGERLLVELAVRLRDEGKSAVEIAEILEEQKKRIRLYAVLDTLEYMKKGGRISSTAAFAGNLLSIKPVIAIEDGAITLLAKARGNKNANKKMTQFIQQGQGIDYDLPCCLAYSGLTEEILDRYSADHKEAYEDGLEQFSKSSIGCVIGTHIGPGAIAVSYFEK
ncbi:MAG: DegV family protein [Lachnospiraceae bacterium]|nr:DegV family protein [Lachnospiraceae bacterium]